MTSKLPTVAIIGRANAGKSSLFNRMVRSQQAIVAREAGTTRDNVIGRVSYKPRYHLSNTRVAASGAGHVPRPYESASEVQLHGDTVLRSADKRFSPAFDKISDFSKEEADSLTGPVSSDRHREARDGEIYDESGAQTQNHEFWLVDTAGLKDPADEFEASIQDQITEAAEAADVIIVVVDTTEYPSDEDRTVAKKALRSKKPVILVTNKADLRTALPDDEFRRLGIRTIIRTSAEHNSGITDVLDAIAAEIPARSENTPDDILRIALIGRPNVGKSHLFNTLAGKQQAIVANVAGTTRDLNRIALRYQSRDIELIDTAGIRRQGKQEVGIEKFSVLRTLQAIEQADICFLLMDVGELSTALDQRLAGMISDAGKGLVLVVSKWDSVASISGQDSDDLRSDEVIDQGNAAKRKPDVVVATSGADRKALTKSDKIRRGRAMKAGQGYLPGKDAYTRDALASQISRAFDFTPWAPLIFTSSVTGQNVTKLFDLACDIDTRRRQPTKTRVLNDLLQAAVQKHPPAGLKNTHPKLRYIVQTDTSPPWFVIHGSNLKFVHWSYKRYLERTLRETYNYAGTPIKFSFIDEKQVKSNKARIAAGKEPVTKAYKKAKEAEKNTPR